MLADKPKPILICSLATQTLAVVHSSIRMAPCMPISGVSLLSQHPLQTLDIPGLFVRVPHVKSILQ